MAVPNNVNHQKIILRRAFEEDSEDVLRWRNDSISAKFSTTGKVNHEDHLRWFPRKIKEQNCVLLIVTLITGEKIGAVRFDLENDLIGDEKNAVVSIHLDPAYRGKGYGRLSLRKSLEFLLENYPINKVLATIHEDNVASQKLFYGLGFSRPEKQVGDKFFTISLTKNNFISSQLLLGLKLWSSNVQWFAEAQERFARQEFDFLELYVIPNTFAPEKLSLLKEMQVNIHVPIEEEFNLLAEHERNFAVMEEAQKFADFFNSEYIIVHPGRGEKMEIPENNWNLLHDQRIIIENVPVKPIGGGLPLQGYSYEQLRELLEKSGRGFCLDFSHAFKAAKSLNIDPYQFTEKLLSLNPEVFHVVGGHLGIEEDEHLNLWEGDFDWKWIKQKILESKCKKVVLEVPKKNGGSGDLENDVKNMDWFRRV